MWSEDKLNKKFVVAENFAEHVSTAALHAWRVGDLTLFEALTGGAFDLLTGNIAGNLTKIFQKSQMPRGFARGGGMGGFGIDRYIKGDKSQFWLGFFALYQLNFCMWP